ncbi:TnsA-like heteromeric transposase endonuclease subunit [Mycolicibacterium sp. HK-90]|uniref:TnsA-like heteromeric transposase endonuclease subunit n=1 Tax=Mycolicibacterium sp. HK-90 TaxID=3056937 RepID=UPI00265B450E|nr:TnsA-like heteromeric transposase endonuclease subunit [Mycolicibacterium sp. HK-90]WKG00800.1 TnsA-like heteromeric transposase endonuclease subunit [Mycolicibacterium sp. HK-90]
MLTSALSAGPVVAGVVDLEFDTREGRLRRSLERCAAVRFELDCAPVRNFPSFRGQRNFPGLWWFATTGTHVGHESWVERDQLMALDADPDVVGVLSQPFWFHWPDGSRHAPDYFVRHRDGSAVVVDVREDERISVGDQKVFDRSAAACAMVGWDYRRVGALNPVLRANLRWLSGYRHPRVLRVGLAEQLTEVFTRARPLMAGVRAVGTPLVVLPVLFHLLWQGCLAADLRDAPLGDDTLIGLGAGW